MSNNTRAVQNGTNILKARKLIADNAISDVWQYAHANYLSALVSTYNSLIGKKNTDAVKLRKECKANLVQEKVKFDILNTGMKYRAYAIMYCPVCYAFIYKIHLKLLYAKIRKQAEKQKRNI